MFDNCKEISVPVSSQKSFGIITFYQLSANSFPSSLATLLYNFDKGIDLITKIKKNMKNKLLPLIDKILLRKRALIESIFDQLKNISQIEHTRHRSLINFFVNLFAGLIAYTNQEKSLLLI